MKFPSILRVLSRPTALVKSYHPPKTGQIAPLNARKFSATPRRLLLDECLVQTHTLISGIHDMTGLPWAATIPLTALLVRVAILIPIDKYCRSVGVKTAKLRSQYQESRPAMEKKIKQEHRHKSPSEVQEIQVIALYSAWRQVLKQTQAYGWTTIISFIKVPIWFTMMETIRRMTGTEDGMLSLTAKSLTAFKGEQSPGPGTTDELIPVEPSLATEGMLWFEDLMVPDPSLILPFALFGIMSVAYSSGRGTLGLLQVLVPGRTIERARQITYWIVLKNRILKFGALAVVPATHLFPSAMLLYWISSSLAAVFVRPSYHVVTIVMDQWGDRGKPGEEKHKSKPKMQEFRGPTMQDLRNQKKKK